MKNENSFGRLLLLLLITFVLCWGMYYLPDHLFGMKIKRVDMLSDLRFRVKEESFSMDSLRKQLEQADTIRVDSAVLRDSIVKTMGIDSVALALRDSLYQVLYADRESDSLGVRIEDYSVGHIGLKRFFEALKGGSEHPVRIAFLGDSFIEGDIVVADFRSGLQRLFGGGGVGFVPITSVAAQYRPTIEQRTTGWTTCSMLTDHAHRYTLPGMVFEPADAAPSLFVKTTDRYPESDTVSSLKFIYEECIGTKMKLAYNGQPDTLVERLAPTAVITQYEREGCFTEASFIFADTAGFRALGVALESDTGVIVDNYSLRGNSGMILLRLDSMRCRELNAIRPYNLIVLQYGLNIVTDTILQYGWYAKRMEEAVRHVRGCFPDADILMLGVSDRSRQVDGVFETMSAVLALLHAQRQTARRSGVAFWNVFGAMGGENSMVRYVEKNWASKDYTHISFRGGKEIASALLKALLLEKEFYDEMDKRMD